MPVMNPFSIQSLCTPRESVFDTQRRDTVLSLNDFLKGHFILEAARTFFEVNYPTHGMKILVNKAFERLNNIRDQASTFLLSQSMGGGKTHSMIALACLAKYPELRKEFWRNADLGTSPVRVLGFDGRETDYPTGFWGALAEQAGNHELFAPLFTPLQPPGETSWINLLKGPPTIILMDELPPYLAATLGKTIGNTTLADLTVTAISNLMVAANKKELSNVVLVISDLSGTAYESAAATLNNLQQETARSALVLEPVQTQGEEVYHILRTRLFSGLPDLAKREQIAVLYAEEVKKAKKMDLTAESPERYASELRESYPFHFSLRDLYGRFKANQGFQQTRGLLRLMRSVVANLWNTQAAQESLLIHPYDVDLNDPVIYSEFERINPSLKEAIRKDIANGGNSHAEELDAKLKSSSLAQAAAKLIYVSSLSTTPSALIGLRDTEVIAWLCAPGRDISRMRTDILEALPNMAWYLHLSVDGRLYFKNVQNLAAKLYTMVSAYNEENKIQELRSYLKQLFKVETGDVYGSVEILPGPDSVQLQPARVTMVVTDPYSKATPAQPLHPTWTDYYNGTEFKNRILFLTGDRDTMNAVLANAAQLKAIEAILAEMRTEGVSESDVQMKDARNKKDKILISVRSAVQQTFSQLVYPTKTGLRSEFINLNFNENNYNAERQITATLKDLAKFSDDPPSDMWVRKIEDRLFDGQNPVVWNDIKRRAAVKPDWQWHKKDLLEDVKALARQRGLWREEDGRVRKGPFEKDPTKVVVALKRRNPDTGEAVLEIKPWGGDKVYYEVGGADPTSASESVDDYSSFSTSELVVKFLCADSGPDPAPSGKPTEWKNEIFIKGRFYLQGADRFVELRTYPEGVPIRYTTNGSDPRGSGQPYEGPFPLPPGTRLVMAYGEKQGVSTQPFRMEITENPDEWKLDPAKPLVWSTARVFKNKQAAEAYRIMDLVTEFRAKVESGSIELRSQETRESLEYSLPSGHQKSGQELAAIRVALESLLPNPELKITFNNLHFEKGQDILDWQQRGGLDLRQDEVRQ